MVKLKDDTHEELLKLGVFRETMDDIVKKCIKSYKKEHRL
jgi:hypothetical protein